MRRVKISPLSRSPYALYEKAVQSVEFDLDFYDRVYRRHHGRSFRLLREDFCGTGTTACGWVLRGDDHRAWGVDLDPKPMAWGRRHHLSRGGEAARRVTLKRGDVLEVSRPKVDVITAMTFSFWVFRQRSRLIHYFRQVRRSLLPGGQFYLGMFGGTEAGTTNLERQRIPAFQGPDGLRIPGFLYVWEQAAFNPVDNDLLCYIHFRLGDGTWLRRAFRYHWRLWSVAEVREALFEAGFKDVEVYAEGWDDKRNESDGHYRLRRRFENQEAWLAIVVGVT